MNAFSDYTSWLSKFELNINSLVGFQWLCQDWGARPALLLWLLLPPLTPLHTQEVHCHRLQPVWCLRWREHWCQGAAPIPRFYISIPGVCFCEHKDGSQGGRVWRLHRDRPRGDPGLLLWTPQLHLWQGQAINTQQVQAVVDASELGSFQGRFHPAAHRHDGGGDTARVQWIWQVGHSSADLFLLISLQNQQWKDQWEGSLSLHSQKLKNSSQKEGLEIVHLASLQIFTVGDAEKDWEDVAEQGARSLAAILQVTQQPTLDLLPCAHSHTLQFTRNLFCVLASGAELERALFFLDVEVSVALMHISICVCFLQSYFVPEHWSRPGGI